MFEEEYLVFEHRFCLRNLYVNFKKNFGGGALFRDLMMVAVKANYFESRESKMLQIKEVIWMHMNGYRLFPKLNGVSMLFLFSLSVMC